MDKRLIGGKNSPLQPLFIGEQAQNLRLFSATLK